MNNKRKLNDFYDMDFNYKKYVRIRFPSKYSKNYFNLSVPARLLYRYIESDPNDTKSINDIFFNFAITDDDREKLKDLIDELYENNMIVAEYIDCIGGIEHLKNDD